MAAYVHGMNAPMGPGVRKPSADQQKLLARWRTDALDKMPYMASLLFSLRLVAAPGLGTFAVDPGHRLYIDFDALAANPQTWTTQVCAEALLHECGHLFGNHSERATDAGARNSMQHSDFNCAADAEINDDLSDAGCKALATIGAIFPANLGMPDHLTAEEYYGSIMTRRAVQQQQQQQGAGQGQQGSGQGQGQAGSGQGQSHQGQAGAGHGQGQGQAGAGHGQGQGQAGAGQGQASKGSGPSNGPTPGKPYAGCGSAAGGNAAPCEMGDDDGTDLAGEAFAPGASMTEKRRTEIATAASIRDYASKGRGTVPAGLVSRAEVVMAPPVVPWRQVLSSAIKRAVARKVGDFDADPTRRSRRRHNARLADGRRVFYPGVYTPQPTLVVVRDTSGSMGRDELTAVTREVDGIARLAGVRGPELRVLDVDAAVHETIDYTGPAVMTKVTGRGGTDMRVGITAAMELKPTPTSVIVITDGYTPWPAERTRMPLVICVVGDGAESPAKDAPEWAITVVAQDK